MDVLRGHYIPRIPLAAHHARKNYHHSNVNRIPQTLFPQGRKNARCSAEYVPKGKGSVEEAVEEEKEERKRPHRRERAPGGRGRFLTPVLRTLDFLRIL